LIVKPGELERVIETTPTLRPEASSLLLVLDADDDAACELGPDLLSRCVASSHLPCAVVFANREFEAWFLGAIESLRGKRGIASEATFVGDPERPRDAKGRLDVLMGRRSYLDVDDQPALTAVMDLQLARERCPSFDKLVREIERLA
jgi:hypothetical protein